MKSGSLFRRLLPPVGGAVAILTLAITVLGAVMMRRAVIDRAHQRAQTLVSAARDQIGLAMQMGDHAHLTDLLRGLGENPDIQVVRVLRPNGVVAASSRTSERGSLIAEHLHQTGSNGDYLGGSFWRSGLIHSVAPLRNESQCHQCHGTGDRLLGLLDLDVAVNPHLTGFTAFGSLSMLLGFLYFVAVAGIVVPTIAYVVVRPLRAVISGLHRVERGELDMTLQHSGTGEIDEVIDGFNHMVEQLRDAHATEKEKRRLERSNAEHLASVGQLATGLAHEFRNPLSSVKAVVEVLAAEATPGDQNRDVLRAAASELDRMDQILKDLLHYARPRQPARVLFDLNPVVADVARLTFPSFAAGTPAVNVELDDGLPLVSADPDMVRQVLMNLLLNAGQAVPRNAGEITLQTGRNGTHAWCRVADNGAGVPVEHAANVFQPFVTTKPRGSGLGLATSRRLVELLGGSLVLENPGESGASFRFTLPLDGAGA